MKTISYGNNPKASIKQQEGVIQKDLITPFKDRLKTLVGDDSILAFSRKINIPDRTIRDYLQGKTYPTLDRLCAISEGANVDLAWLATGAIPEIKSNTISNTQNKNLVYIPQYDLRASAGAGCLVVSDNPVAEFSFSKEWLIRNNLYNAKLTVVPVCGDSMEPTLMDEDLMLVKLVERQGEAREGVCVIRIDDDIYVKRIQFDHERQGYHIVSDNIAYRPFFIGKEFEGRFDVLGRMVRVLQKAKQTV